MSIIASRILVYQDYDRVFDKPYIHVSNTEETANGISFEITCDRNKCLEKELFVAKIYWKEFAEHVRVLEKGNLNRNEKHGQLSFRGVDVLSYNVHIARVWLQDKVIVWNKEGPSRSRTTLVHSRAVTNAGFDLKDYIFWGVDYKWVGDSPTKLVSTLWNDGADLPAEAVSDALKTYMRFQRLDNKDTLIQEYVQAPSDKKLQMLGFLELAASP